MLQVLVENMKTFEQANLVAEGLPPLVFHYIDPVNAMINSAIEVHYQNLIEVLSKELLRQKRQELTPAEEAVEA